METSIVKGIVAVTFASVFIILLLIKRIKRKIYVRWQQDVSGFVLYERILGQQRILTVEHTCEKVHQFVHHNKAMMIFENIETMKMIERRRNQWDKMLVLDQ